MDRVRTDLLAVLTLTEAHFVDTALVLWIIIILDHLDRVRVKSLRVGAYFYHALQGLRQRLSILSETSLQVYCVLAWPKCSLHEQR